MATTELQAIVRFRFHVGNVEEFKGLSAQCMEIVRAKDTGTLQYDTYFNDDETECIVIERFHDSDALIQHGENLAHLMDANTATGSVTSTHASFGSGWCAMSAMSPSRTFQSNVVLFTSAPRRRGNRLSRVTVARRLVSRSSLKSMTWKLRNVP